VHSVDLISTATPAATVFEYHREENKEKGQRKTEVFQIALEIITFYISWTGTLLLPSPRHLGWLFNIHNYILV